MFKAFCRVRSSRLGRQARHALALAASMSTLPMAAQAQLTAKAEAGMVAARGNADTDSANAKLDITREFVRWSHTGGFTGVYASDSTGTTTQRWEARGQSDYAFYSKGFSFVSGRYEDDRFSGFEYQTTLGAGLGWRFFDDPVTRLTGQLGFGYKTFTTREALADDGVTIIPREREENVVATGKVDLEHALTPTTSVLNKLLVEADVDNRFLSNDLSLQVRMIEQLALAVGFSVRYNTNPPPGFEQTDTLTTVNLVYELK